MKDKRKNIIQGIVGIGTSQFDDYERSPEMV